MGSIADSPEEASSSLSIEGLRQVKHGETSIEAVKRGTLSWDAWDACCRKEWVSATTRAARALVLDPWASVPLYCVAFVAKERGAHDVARVFFELFERRNPLAPNSTWAARAAAHSSSCASVASEKKRREAVARETAASGLAPVSVVVIVRDDAVSLRRLLTSLRPLEAAETVVVDTGSSDDSVETARSFGATTLSRTWDGDYAAARNYGVDAASRPWILSADSDDCFTAGSCAAIRKICASPRSANYHAFKTRLGERLSLFQTRLWRTSTNARFRPKLHERIWPDSPLVYHADVVIDHLGDPQKTTERAAEKLDALTQLCAEEPEKAYWKFHFAVSLAIAGRNEEARAAALEFLASRDPFARDDLARQYAEHLVAWYDVHWSDDPSLGLASALRLATAHPSSAEYWCLAGDACAKLSRPIGALSFYGIAKEIGAVSSDGPWLVDASKRWEHPETMSREIREKLGDDVVSVALEREKQRELRWHWDL